MTTTAMTGSELAKALIAAQATIRAVVHDARNEFHKYDYTSSEAIISEGKTALTAAGLALIPLTQELPTAAGENSSRYEVHRSFLLVHGVSGESLTLTTAWPVHVDKGKTVDKAVASAVTTSLAYLLRDLLLMPRVDKGDDLAAREDRPVKEKPRATATIGEPGAQRLLALAARKGTSLDQHGPLASLAPETARTIWRQLSALPDVSTTPPVAAVSGNGAAKRNGCSTTF